MTMAAPDTSIPVFSYTLREASIANANSGGITLGDLRELLTATGDFPDSAEVKIGETTEHYRDRAAYFTNEITVQTHVQGSVS
jgi:hypothetical protein